MENLVCMYIYEFYKNKVKNNNKVLYSLLWKHLIGAVLLLRLQITI